jgi:hypothetical protein
MGRCRPGLRSRMRKRAKALSGKERGMMAGRGHAMVEDDVSWRKDVGNGDLMQDEV